MSGSKQAKEGRGFEGGGRGGGGVSADHVEVLMTTPNNIQVNTDNDIFEDNPLFNTAEENKSTGFSNPLDVPVETREKTSKS